MSFNQSPPDLNSHSSNYFNGDSSSAYRPYYNQDPATSSSPVLGLSSNPRALFDDENSISPGDLDDNIRNNFQYDTRSFMMYNNNTSPSSNLNQKKDPVDDQSKLWEPSTSAHFMTASTSQQEQFGDDPAIGTLGPKLPGAASTTVKVPDVGPLESYKSNVLSIVNLLNEYVLSHPFVVIRRQAQVNNRSDAYHLTPFTVIPFMFRIQAKQGVGAFFKGLPSVLVNYVLVIGGESLCYNMLGFPIEFDFSLDQIFSERFVKHLLLKSISILLVTPFICSGSVETVQSLIVNDSPSPFESIKEGVLRIFHFRNDRKFFIHQLIVPSVLYHISYYLVYSLAKEAIRYYFFHQETNSLKSDPKLYKNPQIQRLIDQEEQEQQQQDILTRTRTVSGSGAGGILSPPSATLQPNHSSPFSYPEENQTNRLMIELKCSLYANIITDVLLYPFQTVLYRIFLQGTRTLIDNVDGSTAVMPLISQYDSVTDCYHTIVRQEGSGGLFKGFGALILQYAFQASIIQLANLCVDSVLNSY